MLTYPPLPQLDAPGKRGAVERALKLWHDRGVFGNVSAEPGRLDRYRVLSGDGTLWENLTLKEARLLCHGAASAWQRRDRQDQPCSHSS